MAAPAPSTSPPRALANAAGSTASAREVALAAACLLLAVAICAPAVSALSIIWTSADYYAQGYLIPLVAVFVALGNRRQIAAALLPLQPPRWGPAVAFAAAVFEVLAIMGDVGFAAGAGIPLLLAATAYAIGGGRLLRQLGAPLLVLALMVPPPRFLTYELLFRLKLFVTRTAALLLQLSGETVAADGNRVLVPGHSLFIADACSGLTSIITLLPLSVIVAYYLSDGIWRRALLVASVVPIAIAANVVRVILTVELVSKQGVQFAEGALHESFGLATFVAGTLALVLSARLLR